jgi:HEAT repeat protein
MFLVVAVGILFSLFRGARPFPQVASPVASSPATVRDLSHPWIPDVSQIEEVKPEEFPAVLEELKKKPELPQLRTIAGRLMKTAPTEKQQERHAAYKRAKELSDNDKEKKGKAGPPKDVLDRLAKDDDIRQVSLALQTLLEKEDPESRWYGAKACQKWGTEENVVALIGAAETAVYGGDAVRGAACHALGAIGDPRGISAVIKRSQDTWDSGHQAEDLMAAFVAFGPKAEDELLPLVNKSNHRGRGLVIKALGKIGTKKSIAPLEKNRDFFVQAETDAALGQIRARLAEKDK